MARNKIHSIDSLEKEIMRLQLLQKDREHKLDKQWGKMRNHFGAILLNSLRRKKEKQEDPSEERSGFFESFLRNDKIEETLHAISEKISGRVSVVINQLFEKFFKK
jgi:hypothetical protein